MLWMGLVAITGRIERRVSRGDETNCRCKENHPSPCHRRIFQGAHPPDYTGVPLTILPPSSLLRLQPLDAATCHACFALGSVRNAKKLMRTAPLLLPYRTLSF